MKRFALWSILFALVVVTTPVYAATYELGADVALKAQYFRFTDDNIKDFLGAETGAYVGLAAYKQLFIPNFYLGLEAGWAGTTNDEDTDVPGVFNNEITYVPIELNAKYVFPINPCLDIDLGAGVSVNYIKLETETFGFSIDDDDWVFGGQFFVDVNYKINNFFVGVGAKFQLTDEVSFFGTPTDTNANNLRAGIQVGYKF